MPNDVIQISTTAKMTNPIEITLERLEINLYKVVEKRMR